MNYRIFAKDKTGTVLAEASSKDVIELESAWYFSPEQVDMSCLKISKREYHCPYKGTAHWVDLILPDKQAKNVGWVYQTPMYGYEHIAGRIAFYDRETSNTFAKAPAES